MPSETKPLERFSNDLIYEILRRLSLEALARCRAVCREWKSITNEPRFTELTYPGWCQNIAGYYHWNKFVSTGAQTTNMSRFMPRCCFERCLRVKACDKGILLCREEDLCGNGPAAYFVCKPSTKECVKIPNPKAKYWTHVRAIQVLKVRPHYVHFKILCVSEHSKNKLWYEIFDSEAWRWKRLAVADLKSGSDLGFLRDADTVIVEGKVNWVEDNNWFIFNMPSEILSVVPLCIESDRKMADLRSARLLDHEGKLGLLLPTKELDEAYLFVVKGKDPITDQPMWRKTTSYGLRSLKGLEDLSPNSVMYVLIQSMRNCDEYIDRVIPFSSDYLPCNLKDLENRKKS